MIFNHSQHLGPLDSIGNIIDLAGSIIETTTNIAMGITGAATGAAFGTVNAAHDAAAQVKRQVSTSAVCSAKQALDAVEVFINSRRGEVNRFRSLKQEQRNEIIEMERNNRGGWGSCNRNSGGPLFGCSSSNSRSYPFSHSSFGCSAKSNKGTADHYTNINNNAENNVDKLEMKQSNSPLKVHQSWSGKECRLKTSNGPLNVHGSLTASDSIELESSNGQIVVDGALISLKDLRVKTSNGVFIVHGDSIVAKDLQVHMSNAPLQLKSFIEAKRIELKTKNAPVIIGNIAVGSELYVKTCNSPIEIHIVSIASRSAHIEIETSNAPVSVYLPSDFSGYFNVKSNWLGSSSIVAKSNESIVLKYDTNESSKKSGSCKNLGNKSDVDITIKTSNASATMYI
jgi:uncharacterized Zn ribbon protein